MTPSLPPHLEHNNRLDRWVQFGDDGTVSVRTGKVEIGQGIVSAFAQMAADELDVDYARIRMIPADTQMSPNEGVTAGSKSMEDGGIAMRTACAEVRHLFLLEAERILRVQPNTLILEDGTFKPRSAGPSITYWELAQAVDLGQPATGNASLKPYDQLALTGRSLPRLDIPDKLTVGAFIHDLDLPDMLHGRILRPPSYGAQILTFESSAALAMRGVIKVVRDGRFIGVIAKREEQAVAAVAMLERNVTWSEEPLLPDFEDLAGYMAGQQSLKQTLIETGNTSPAGGHKVSARYSRPFLAHGSIGPSCAVAAFTDEGLQIWSHSQSIHFLRKDIATVFGLEMAEVLIHHLPGAGCYGHNAADDVALDAALLARAVPKRPVRVQWSREDEMTWEPFGPAMTVVIEGSIDEAGEIISWRHDMWSNPHVTRPGLHATPSLLAAWHLQQPFARPPAIDGGGTGNEVGASQRNAVPAYAFPNQKVVHHILEDPPLRTSSIRSIGAFANVFAIESFMDELASRTGVDAIELRLRYLEDERARAVITALREHPILTDRKAVDQARGIGLGFARYNNKGAYGAVAVEVEVANDVKVLRAVAAVDCGRVVNPDGVANQIEGGVVQAISWTILEQVRFDRTRILTRNWDDYPILKFSNAPMVETILVDRPDQPSLGVGEAVTAPTAAAIANAVFNATGLRVRDLPITRDRMIETIMVE